MSRKRQYQPETEIPAKRLRGNFDMNMAETAGMSLGLLTLLGDELKCNECKYTAMAVFVQVCEMYSCTAQERDSVINAVSQSLHVQLPTTERREINPEYRPAMATAIFAQDSWQKRLANAMKGKLWPKRTTRENGVIVVGVLMVVLTLYLGSHHLEMVAKSLLQTVQSMAEIEVQLSEAQHLFQQATEAARTVSAGSGSGWAWLNSVSGGMFDNLMGYTADAQAKGEIVRNLGLQMASLQAGVYDPFITTARYLVKNIPSCQALLGMWTAETAAQLSAVAATYANIAQHTRVVAGITSLAIALPLTQLVSDAMDYLREGPRTSKGTQILTMVTQREGNRLHVIDLLVKSGHFTLEEAEQQVFEEFGP